MVFLHELQPPCQQLMPWVTRSKPRYPLAFGKDNTHLRLCKGLFCRGQQRLALPRRGLDGRRAVGHFPSNREQNQPNLLMKRLFAQATWESRGVAASQSDQPVDLSHPRHSHSAANPAAWRLHFVSALAQPARKGRVSQTDKTTRLCVLRPRT